MRYLLTSITLLLLASIAFGQATLFDKIIHDGSASADYGYDIFVDGNGNKYITGKYKSTIDFGQGVSITPINNYDAFVAKYDVDNNIQWAKSIGGNITDEGNAVTVDGNGDVIVAGVFFSSINFGTDTLFSAGNIDIFVVKFDSDGNYIWMKHGYTENQEKPSDIQVDSQGNYILLGYYDVNDSLTLPFNFEGLELTTSKGERDVFVIKMDSDGNPLWGVTGGGADNDYPGGLVIDENDNIYFNGNYDNVEATFGTTVLPNNDNGYELFLAKVSSSGSYEWAVSANGPGDDKGFAIDYIDMGDVEGGVVLVAGSFRDSLFTSINDEPLISVGGNDIYVLVYSDAGGFLNRFAFGGDADDEAKAVNIIQGTMGDYYVSGITKSDLITPNDTLYNYGKRDVFVMRMEAENIIWAKNYGGSSDDYLNASVIDATGTVYFGGNFKSSTGEFNPFSLTSKGNYDFWLGQMEEPNAKVIFACNMSAQISNGNFNPATDAVYVRGNFQTDAGDTSNWAGNMFQLFREHQNEIYQLEVLIPRDNVGKTYEFKYIMNDTWESIDNRTFDLQYPTTWTGYPFFNNDSSTAPLVPITFEVDMSVQVDKGNFDAATGTVTLAGTMNGWDAGATSMSDGDGDLTYSVTLDLTEGDEHEFKFVKNGDGWESVPNRTYIVPANPDTYLAYFDNDDGGELTEITLSFQVDMELEIAAARFDPANDTLSARGSFNGWSDVTILSASATNPNIYEGAAQYETFAGDEIYYKYAYTSALGTNWEGGANFVHLIDSTDIANGFSVVPLRGYNQPCGGHDFIDHEFTIRFIVDMNGAVDANGVTFPSIDNVAIAGANPPLAWHGGGWPDDDPNVIFLFDDGTNGDDVAGDKFYSKEITFPIYSPLTIQYKYGANWGLASNNGTNDNEAGVGSDHFLTLFPEFWYGDAVDVFGVMGDKDVVNSVDQVGSEIPTVYELGQNYPNPFNPSTVINFSIPESGLVTLKVFNILGQEVVELVNAVKSAGSYEVSFDATGLTSGMYVYRIQAGSYTATKKMLLLK